LPGECLDPVTTGLSGPPHGRSAPRPVAALDQTLIISDAFVKTCGNLRAQLIGLGRYALRGVGRPQMLWTLDSDAAV
jgi:hypothetical protein